MPQYWAQLIDQVVSAVAGGCSPCGASDKEFHLSYVSWRALGAQMRLKTVRAAYLGRLANAKPARVIGGGGDSHYLRAWRCAPNTANLETIELDGHPPNTTSGPIVVFGLSWLDGWLPRNGSTIRAWLFGIPRKAIPLCALEEARNANSSICKSGLHFRRGSASCELPPTTKHSVHCLRELQ